MFYFDLSTNEFGKFEDSKWDQRDPSYSKGNFLSSKDQYGIFNLYYETKNTSKYITNVVGGAFMPSISVDNKIVFSLYEKGKYTLAIINEAQFIDENIGYSNITIL